MRNTALLTSTLRCIRDHAGAHHKRIGVEAAQWSAAAWGCETGSGQGDRGAPSGAVCRAGHGLGQEWADDDPDTGCPNEPDDDVNLPRTRLERVLS